MDAPMFSPAENTASGGGAGVEPRPLGTQVYELLWARILRRELEPGKRLPLAKIARSMGVSVTPVRDAVHHLAADGLVVVSPRKGTIVAPISETEVRELYQVRLIFEPPSAEIAARTLSETELRYLAGLVEQLEAFVAAGSSDVDAYLRDLATDGEFHAGFIRGVRNERLNAFYRSIQASLTVARALFPRSYHDTDQRAGEHRRILEALANRDGQLAREAVEEHLRIAERDTIRHLAAVEDMTRR